MVSRRHFAEGQPGTLRRGELGSILDDIRLSRLLLMWTIWFS